MLKSFPYMNMCTSHFTHWCLYACAFSYICFEVSIALFVGKRILLWYRIFFGFQEKRVIRFLLDFGRCFVIICPFSILLFICVPEKIVWFEHFCLIVCPSDRIICLWILLFLVVLYSYFHSLHCGGNDISQTIELQIPSIHMLQYTTQVLGVILALLDDSDESVQLTAVSCLLTVTPTPFFSHACL